MNEQENKNIASEDNFIIDEGFKIEEEEYAETKNGKVKGKKKSGCSTGLWLGIIVLVAVALSAVICISSFDYLGLRFSGTSQVVVQIEQGMSGKEIAHTLKESGAISNEFMFRIYSKLTKSENLYKYGVYTFSSELSYDDIALKLQTEGAKADTVTVMIPEQASLDDIAALMEKNGVCTASDFKSAAENEVYNYDFIEDIPVQSVYHKLEGYLFPDTYDFYCYDSKTCAKLAVDKMLGATNDKVFTDANIKKAEKLGFSMHQILTMASIVELEASAQPTEMSNVAAVFFNRLNWDEPKFLGSSPTAEYPYGNGRYDTNKSEGLPPGPLCSPSLNAVNASLNPTKDFKYTYFVTDINMKFYYRSSLSEHYSVIAQLKKKGLWLG